MTPSSKKLVAVIGILIWLVLYALVVMRLAVAILPNASGFIQLAFYAIAGLAWIIPIGLLLPWMHRQPPNR